MSSTLLKIHVNSREKSGDLDGFKRETWSLKPWL